MANSGTAGMPAPQTHRCLLLLLQLLALSVALRGATGSSLGERVQRARSLGLRRFRLVGAQVEPANDTSPAACVDPFWACERTNLPQTRGIAARWFWPKALTGNTHPGAGLPNGMVTVVAYSGAYPRHETKTTSIKNK